MSKQIMHSIKEKAAFLRQYAAHPRKIGAVAPSGKALTAGMMEPVDFEAAKLIVEYGPGTGSFTEELVRRKKPETVLLLIEQNRDFCRMLHERFAGEQNVWIVCGSAEKADRIAERAGFSQADFVVSGLPFTSLPKNVSAGIFEATKRLIGDTGRFITFQYSMVKCNFFSAHFRFADIHRVRKNLPPAYILVMENK